MTAEKENQNDQYDRGNESYYESFQRTISDIKFFIMYKPILVAAYCAAPVVGYILHMIIAPNNHMIPPTSYEDTTYYSKKGMGDYKVTYKLPEPKGSLFHAAIIEQTSGTPLIGPITIMYPNQELVKTMANKQLQNLVGTKDLTIIPQEKSVEQYNHELQLQRQSLTKEEEWDLIKNIENTPNFPVSNEAEQKPLLGEEYPSYDDSLVD